jgi:DNA-binding beta-propeller fold protein YncE
MSRFHRRRGTKSDLLRGRPSRRWWLAVAIALGLAFGAAPAQADPFVYVTSSSGPPGYVGEVFQYYIGAGGLLTPLSPPTVRVGGFPGEVAVSPDGKSVYITGNSGPLGNVGEVFQFDVGAGGTLSPKSPATVPANFSPGELAVSPDGKSVYVTASSGPPAYQGYILQYDVGAGGALSPKSPAMVVDPFGPITCKREGTGLYCTGAIFSGGGVAVSPDGKSVYVAGYLSAPFAFSHPGEVLQYDVGASGALSPKNPPSLRTGSGAGAVAVSPDGASVYVANGGGVSQYDVGAGGALSPKNPLVVAGRLDPRAVAVSPDGQSLYVAESPYFYPAVGDVSQYDVGAGGGALAEEPGHGGPRFLHRGPGGEPGRQKRLRHRQFRLPWLRG